jgi:hypothetical protein
MVLQMCAIGEESGSIDHMLGKAADFYEAEVDDMVAGLSSLMEPIIIVFLGGLIGGIVVAMYLPIFKLGRWSDAGFCGAGRHIGIAGVFGLLIGSFLNVVIHRLPKMLERQWAAECAPACRQSKAPDEAPPFNLVTPRSRCPHCGHPIRWYENIPVASYLALKGKLLSLQGGHQHALSLVEMATGVLFAWCAWRWGLDSEGACLVRLRGNPGGADTDRLGHHAAAGRPDLATAVGRSAGLGAALDGRTLVHCSLGCRGRLHVACGWCTRPSSC